MESSLVMAVCQALVEEGFATFRFNFRGVGNSEGPFTKGEKEHEDVHAALDLLIHWPGVKKGRVGLAGSSFGASMVLVGLTRYKVARSFVLISPPVTALEHPSVASDKRPKLLIVGERDRLVSYSSLKEKVDSSHAAIELQMVPGADHSWRGYESEAAQQATRFLVRTL